MENHKKRRGISLTRLIERSPAYKTPNFDKSNACLVGSNAYSCSQTDNSLSIHYAYRSSSAPKPHISFTYADPAASTVDKNAKQFPVTITKRALHINTPTKNQAQVENTWL